MLILLIKPSENKCLFKLFALLAILKSSLSKKQVTTAVLDTYLGSAPLFNIAALLTLCISPILFSHITAAQRELPSGSVILAKDICRPDMPCRAHQFCRLL